MAITTKGFQGTVSDVDMSTQLGAHHGPSVRSSGDLLVTAGSNRQLSIAAGTADFGFVKYTSDAAQVLTLAPPSSGGKFYAVTIDRQWSPTNTAILKADDLNVATDGTAPTVIPSAALTALAALPRTPGTAGSPGGHRQVISVVHVRAADTTLTLFDTRLIRTGGGNLTSANFWGLIVGSFLNYVIDGAIVSVLRHTMRSGGLHIASRWQRDTNGALVPVATIDTDNTGAVGRSARDDVTDLVGSPPVGTMALDRLATSTTPVATYRWNGSAWRVWDSEWTNFTYSMSNLAFGTVALCRFRYRAGRVLVEFYGYGNVSVGAANAVITMGLPVPADTAGGQIFSRSRAIDAGNAEFPLDVGLTDANNVKFQFWNGNPIRAVDMTVSNLQTWNNGDLLILTFEYDPLA